MGLPGRTLASILAAMTLAPVLLTAPGCSARPCAGQCGPPFQLHIAFRHGTSQPAAVAAMRKCQADPLVISIGQPYRTGPGGQWTAIIYTTKLPSGPGPIPLLTCLHHSPAVTAAVWPD